MDIHFSIYSLVSPLRNILPKPFFEPTLRQLPVSMIQLYIYIFGIHESMSKKIEQKKPNGVREKRNGKCFINKIEF